MVKSPRASAAECGQNTYSTGIPCAKQHVPLRYTNTGACVGCIREYARVRALKVKKYRNPTPYPKTVEYSVDPRDLKVLDAFVEALRLAREF